MTSAPASFSSARDRRWLILGVIAVAQLMVVLDPTVMNVALASAQRALHFSTVDRQWVVTAYTLAFGSLLLLGGRLADMAGRKVTFLAFFAGVTNLSTIVLMPRVGPEPLVASGMLAGRSGWPSWARTPATRPACSARSSWPESAWAW
jgi:MFS family permease